MLWVLKRPISMRPFFWAPKTYAKIMGKKINYNFTLKFFVYLNLWTFTLTIQNVPNCQTGKKGSKRHHTPVPLSITGCSSKEYIAHPLCLSVPRQWLGARSAISSESYCWFRGHEFDPGPTPYFHGHWWWNIFYGHSPSVDCCQRAHPAISHCSHLLLKIKSGYKYKSLAKSIV